MSLKHCVVFNSNLEVKRRTSGAYRFANQMESLGWTATVVEWTCDWPEDQLLAYLDAIVGDQTLLLAESRGRWTFVVQWTVAFR